MLKRDISLAKDLTELRICVQELLSVKVKRRIGLNGYLYLQLKIIVRVFLPIKLRNPHRWITITPLNMGSTELPEFNEGALRIPKHQERSLDK